MSRVLVVAIAAIALLLSGCSAVATSRPSQAASAPATVSTPRHTSSATPSTTVAPSIADSATMYTVTDDADPSLTDSEVAFFSPSKNIECGIVLSGSSASLWGCSVRDHTWQAPAAASGDICFAKGEDCGSGLQAMGTGAVTGRGEFVFESQRAIDGPGPVDVTVRALPYGHSVSANGVTCVSLAAGMTCSNAQSGHGFTLSRSVYLVN